MKLRRAVYFLSVALVGCTPLPSPLDSIPPVCRDAGFNRADLDAIRPAIEEASSAGAGRENLLADADTACAACGDPAAGCDEQLCRECFAALVDEFLGSVSERE